MLALACWRPALRGVWRQVLALALLAGLLGGVALGAVAGARRTASAYGQYLAAIKASDVFVNVPGTLPGMAATRPYELISALPGVIAHAAYIGLSGVPLRHGKPVNSFLVNGLNGSLDGEYFGQDRATVLAGRLAPQGSTSTVVLTPAVAKALGTGVGGTVSYSFQPVDPQRRPAGKRFTRSFRVAAIQAEAGYGFFAPGKMSHLLQGQPAVAGWSEFAFAQLPIDGTVVPALGLRRDLGSVQPPTTSGREMSGPDQIELGTAPWSPRPPCRRLWGRHLGSGQVNQSRSRSSPRR